MNLTNNSFRLLREELKRRWNTPMGQVSFWTYLLVAIFGIGAVGIWVEIIRALLSKQHETEGILTAIYTYFPAIAAGSALQILMDSKKEHLHYLRSFSILSGFVIGLLIVPYSTGLANLYWAIIFGILGVLASLWLWWIANGCNPSFLDIDPNDSLGANPESEPAGSTSGYTV